MNINLCKNLQKVFEIYSFTDYHHIDMLPKFLKYITIMFNISKEQLYGSHIFDSQKNVRTPAEEKSDFRRMMKKRLAEYEKDFLKVRKDAESAYLMFTESQLYRDSRTILAFMAMGCEMDTRAVIQKALSDGKRVAVPRIIPGDDCQMDFYFLSATESLEKQLEKSDWGIFEPKETLEKLDSGKLPILSLLLVPGLAFSRSGARLGRGKGYYDRYIEKLYAQKSMIHLPVALVGWGFEMQVFDEVPIDDHDAMLTHLVTEKGIILCE